MSRNKLYIFVISFTLIGGVWLLWNYFDHYNTRLTVCPFRFITGISCPACGSTRTAILLMKGELSSALTVNPLTFITLSGTFISFVWIIIDLMTRQSSFHRAWQSFEQSFKKKGVWIPTAAVVAILWIRNIWLGL